MNPNPNTKEIPMGQTTTNPALALRIAELSAPSSNEFHEHPEAVGYRRGLLAAYRIVVGWDGTDADLLTECRTLAVSLGWDGTHPDYGDAVVDVEPSPVLVIRADFVESNGRFAGGCWWFDTESRTERLANLSETDVLSALADRGFGATAAAALVATAKHTGEAIAR